MISIQNLRAALTVMVDRPSELKWAEIKDVTREPSGMVCRFSVRDIRNHGTPGEWVRIYPALVATLVTQMWVGGFELDRETIAQFVGADWAPDRVGACQLLQICYFREVKYG